jgi:hypothetical protein
MANVEVLTVTFHFNGEFVVDGSQMQYCNGDLGVSHIDKDKLSIPELNGHLLDHTTFPRCVRMYWLPKGAELNSGMRLLVDDKSCMDMLDEIGSVGSVDIYTEQIELDMAANEVTEYGDDVVFDLFRDENRMDLDGNPMDSLNALAIVDNGQNGQKGDQNVENEGEEEQREEEEEEEESDIDGTGFTSDEDDEVREIRSKYKEFMAEARKRGDIPMDTPITLDVPRGTDTAQVTGGEDGIVYFDSDQDASYDEDSDGVSRRRNCRFPIFDSQDETPHFAVDMCFRGRDQLKDAIERYALKMKVNIRYPKNDNQRLRAVCMWKGCPWVLHASYNSRSDWFQIVTYNPEHACCPELKNKRLSTKRICDKYESTIKANPAWKARSMKETVQEDMGVDVSITMIKRAKARVVKKLMDRQSGEYSKLFDYALELKRSNPGTSVHVALDPEETDHVFQRIYICLAACKRGFLDGCRRVIGLDGCFLKGPMKGELLSAVGRDANNQIYPIAWAVVEYENKDSWGWFLGHLQKDICIPYGAEGWVFITDKQKVMIAEINTCNMYS